MSDYGVWRGGCRAAKLSELAKKALKALRVKNAEVGVFLLGKGEMRRLKARFFKGKKGVRPAGSGHHPAKSRQADVLSFLEPKNFPHPEARRRYLGEIYLNKNLGGKGGRLPPLLIHGLLHLLGFSHGRKRDILKMESLEKKLSGRILKNNLK